MAAVKTSKPIVRSATTEEVFDDVYAEVELRLVNPGTFNQRYRAELRFLIGRDLQVVGEVDGKPVTRTVFKIAVDNAGKVEPPRRAAVADLFELAEADAGKGDMRLATALTLLKARLMEFGQESGVI